VHHMNVPILLLWLIVNSIKVPGEDKTTFEIAAFEGKAKE